MELTQMESMLLETLVMATSQNVEQIKSAEVKLRNWEVQSGYYSSLIKIISNYSVDPTVRCLATFVFKNGVDKYWRKNAPNAIQEEEKYLLRQEIMNTFREPVNIVAVQLANLTSRVARFDCPKEWPELIPNLIHLIKNEDLLVQYRGLFTLNQVIKALASKRLPEDSRVFQMIAAEIYPFMLNYWNAIFQVFLLQVENNNSNRQETLSKVLLALKILRKLTTHGFKKPHESLDVMNFVSSIFGRIKDMFLFRKYEEKSSELVALSEKLICYMTSIVLALLENHPYSFVSFLQPSLTFILTFIFSDTADLLFEKFVIQCLHLMKNIILCPEYKKSKYMGASYVDNQNDVTLEASHIKNDFFTPEILEHVCTKLITHYFLLTKEDLQLWETDPENFGFEEVGDSWKYSLHPSTHSLYLALFREYREVLTPLVLKLVQSNRQIVDPQDLKGILEKDAIYLSIGLCAFEFYDEIDFEEWFNSVLVHELSIKEPNYRIIRRRVVWLVGKWTEVKPPVDLRPAVCSAVIPHLCREEDMVVRLTTAMSLISIVDSLEFTPDHFPTFLGGSFSMLFTLLQEVKECSSKMQILRVMSFMIQKVGEDIKPYSQSLAQYLPWLWEESANHNMLRCVIVTTLVQFVGGLFDENLSWFWYPVIEYCTDVKNDAHIYLIEEGLELWYAVMKYSSTLTPELLNLYKNMPSILEDTLEYVDCCCNIIQSYILLDPEKFLMERGESLVTLCSSMLASVVGKDAVKVMQVVETAIKAYPEFAIKIFMTILVETVLSINLEDECWTMKMTMYFTIISRVILFSKEVFSQVLQKAAQVKNGSVETLLQEILLVWNKKMPLVTEVEKRKLLALALSSLLNVSSNVVMSQFAPIVKNLVETLNDIMDMDCLSAEMNSLMLAEEEGYFNEDDVNKVGKRKEQLNESDPVYKIELKSYLESQLNELKNQIGPINFENLLKTVEAEILQQCRMYISV